MGYTATDAGLALTAGGVATMLVMPLSGYLTPRVDPRILIGVAFTVQVIALWNMSMLSTQMSFHDAAVARMIQSVGLPFLFVPVTNAAYIGLRPEENNQASALMNVSRNLGGTFGISLVQTLLAQRAQIHQAQYVETLNPLNPNYTHAIQQLTHALVSHGASQAQAAKMATGLLYRQLLQQSNMLSYIDAFHILMIVVACGLPLIFLMQGPGKAGSRTAAAAP
jgi:DHA2 family multidrug resistance protein